MRNGCLLLLLLLLLAQKVLLLLVLLLRNVCMRHTGLGQQGVELELEAIG